VCRSDSQAPDQMTRVEEQHRALRRGEDSRYAILLTRKRSEAQRCRDVLAPEDCEPSFGIVVLQDFLVDRKVARNERDTVPLVVDGRDRIVWVVGQTVAEDFRVTDPSQGVILLKVRHLGGVG